MEKARWRKRDKIQRPQICQICDEFWSCHLHKKKAPPVPIQNGFFSCPVKLMFSCYPFLHSKWEREKEEREKGGRKGRNVEGGNDVFIRRKMGLVGGVKWNEEEAKVAFVMKEKGGNHFMQVTFMLLTDFTSVSFGSTFSNFFLFSD